MIDEESIDRSELVFNLNRVMNRLGQDFEALHRRSDWTWAGFRLMNVLWSVGEAELRDIARLSGASRATIWSALQTLERDNLVVRERDEDDKRLVLVKLTPGGRRALSAGIRAQAAREQQWFDILSIDERAQLRLLLERVSDQPTPPDPVG